MNFLPKASGTRPRLACEITPRGVVAARSADAASPVAAIAKAELADGAVIPSLKPHNIVDRVAVTAALRRTLEIVGGKANARGAELTLVIPDGAVRVLLLDFDSLPSKITEALPLVRFRLKKLVPFDADEAMISYQVMSSGKAGVRVLAVAIPRDVLGEYEAVAREAGFEPGAVLPSTLAALAAVDSATPVLLVNANPLGVTTAISREGVLLLHLSVDLAPSDLPDIPAVLADEDGPIEDTDPAPPANSPYNGPTVLADLSAEKHNAILIAPTSMGTLTEDASGRAVTEVVHAALQHGATVAVPLPGKLSSDAMAEEIAQAVSKGAAYFEDNLAAAPTTLWSAGPLGAERLRHILNERGLTEAEGLKVREVVATDALAADAATGGVMRGWMAGVVGALKG